MLVHVILKCFVTYTYYIAVVVERLYNKATAHKMSMQCAFSVLLPSVFTPLHEVVQSLTPEQREHWERLYMFRKGYAHLHPEMMTLTHPLIWPHPLTGKEVRQRVVEIA